MGSPSTVVKAAYFERGQRCSEKNISSSMRETTYRQVESALIATRLHHIRGRPTGCATRLQQAGGIVRNGFTSNLGPIACLLTMLKKFRLSAETMNAMKNGPEPLRLEATISLRIPWAYECPCILTLHVFNRLFIQYNLLSSSRTVS